MLARPFLRRRGVEQHCLCSLGGAQSPQPRIAASTCHANLRMVVRHAPVFEPTDVTAAPVEALAQSLGNLLEAVSAGGRTRIAGLLSVQLPH
ncbi:hypothetical protein H1235_07975 [Pseudoxanthomonas sp. NC8]|nr:hypothetical protein H1235_07975 [Pseudoxanthomonas sp. NC8]